ncbi:MULTISPECIES: aromatic ring-hydroxylating oxygenase subunit alpha [unclassified Nocardioides]|uniref:aromatic ring-hydroxylating oxygenase subunit alpha n=1 Tax=unclassified Nocardioides TaxID=2615069 RepID=UPI0009F152E8|nr:MULTISPECIES: aromatic ring-hydroxylating dioxygenase subunit alpha [unclassified Nocardioides]GAW52581.1 Rieske 2Fe-2S domain protein [Nocardioides sp. PD653-B2]GAW57592.1 Rieske 2Fe-2S domain protein [Nocardioides sp. PD653]
MSDLTRLQDEIRARDGDVPAMLPAAAYTSEEVLAWERRHFFAGGWTCLGRLDELLSTATQRAVMVGDVAALLTRPGALSGPGEVRMFANTCRHRAHELLPEGDESARKAITCPYHAWTYDLAGDLIAAPGYRGEPGFEPADYSLVELPVEVWQGWVFGHALHPVGHPEIVPFADHLGDLESLVAPYDVAALRLADRHSYEIAANWKIVAENYHECYHCPLIHPELCQVTPPTSGNNYQLPGAWVGGAMVLRDGMATMSLTGESDGNPIPGVSPTAVEYLHLLPNLLISAHPDYVMTHRLVPLAPDRTWIECSWYLAPSSDGSLPDPAYAVEFWDLTNRQDWAACESVQRGLASPHFAPGPFGPSEDAVERLVSLVSRGYVGQPLHADLRV